MPKKIGSAYSEVEYIVKESSYEGANVAFKNITKNKDGTSSYNFLVDKTKVSFVTRDDVHFTTYLNLANDGKKGAFKLGRPFDITQERITFDIAKMEGISARRMGDIWAEQQQQVAQLPQQTQESQQQGVQPYQYPNPQPQQEPQPQEQAAVEEPGIIASVYNYFFGEEKKTAPEVAPEETPSVYDAENQAPKRNEVDETPQSDEPGLVDSVLNWLKSDSAAESGQVSSSRNKDFLEKVYSSVLTEPTHVTDRKLDLFKKAADEAGVNSRDLVGLIQHESRCSNDCGKSHIGYGQFTTSTFNSVVKEFKLKTKHPEIKDWSPTNPVANAYAAAYHYKQNLDLVGDDKVKAYVIHNLGQGEGMRFIKQLEKNPDAVIDTNHVRYVDSNPKNYMHKGEFLTYREAYDNMAQILEAASQRVEKAVGSIAQNSQKTPEAVAKDNIAVVMNLQNAINNPSAPEASLPAANKNQKQI